MTFEDGRSAAAEGAAGGAALSGAGAAALAEGGSPLARSLNRATTGLASMKRVISGFHENTEIVAKKEGAYKFMKGIKKVAHGTKYLRTGFLAGSSAAALVACDGSADCYCSEVDDDEATRDDHRGRHRHPSSDPSVDP